MTHYTIAPRGRDKQSVTRSTAPRRRARLQRLPRKDLPMAAEPKLTIEIVSDVV